MKDKILEILNFHLEKIKEFSTGLNKSATTVMSKKSDQELAKSIAITWFDAVFPSLNKISFDQEMLKKYSEKFEKLLEYSRKVSRTISVKALLQDVLDNYSDEIIHKVQIGSFLSTEGLNITPYLEGLPTDEKDYLKEAAICASNNCIRASIILGWCATIDKIHRKIELLGFEKFNTAIDEMNQLTQGKFKRFKKKYIVNSLSELREVFDTDILWVLEYLGYIDGNEHERLRHCFLFRNNSAHPGEAPISGENLYSFYSDITKIVLKNNKFTD